MAATNMNIRMDSDIKTQAQSIFSQFGLDMTTAVNMFLRQVIRERGIPFELKLEPPTVDELTAHWTPRHWAKVDEMLKKSEAEYAAGHYSDASEDLERLGQKYGI